MTGTTRVEAKLCNRIRIEPCRIVTIRSCFVSINYLAKLDKLSNRLDAIDDSSVVKACQCLKRTVRMDGKSFFSPSSLLVKIFSVNTHLFILYHSIELKARKMVIDKENLGF